MLTKENILNFLSDQKSILKEKYHISRIGIFGSYSRGDFSEDSDIDILFEFDDQVEHVFNTKYELREYLKAQFLKEVDLCREKSLNKLFSDRIVKEAIYV